MRGSLELNILTTLIFKKKIVVVCFSHVRCLFSYIICVYGVVRINWPIMYYDKVFHSNSSGRVLVGKRHQLFIPNAPDDDTNGC